MKEKISDAIKQNITKSSINKTDLAMLCGVGNSVITRWCSGKWNFSLSTIELIEIKTGWKLININYEN